MESTCEKCGYNPEQFGRSGTCTDARNELYAFTLGQPRPPFIHQLAVDAYAAQHLDERASAISRLFPLMGLFMVCEIGANGYEVQMAHIEKARVGGRSSWPMIEIRPESFTMNVGHVLATSEPGRDQALRQWVERTWDSFRYAEPILRSFCSED